MSTTLPRDERTCDPDDLQEPSTLGLPVYGTDDAPVLLQLPNLSPSSEPSRSEVTAPTDELAPVQEPGEAEPAEPDDDTVVESNREAIEERRQRRIERQRRKPNRPTSPNWLRNIGQYVFAVVLATVIFAVFVTWKERNKDVSASNPPTPPSVDLPIWENDPTVVVPGANAAESVWGTSPTTPSATASTEPGTSGPTGAENASAPGLGVPDLRLARQPEQPEDSGSDTTRYPNTGVGPITTDALSKQNEAAARWGDDSDYAPTRQATRAPGTDKRSR